MNDWISRLKSPLNRLNQYLFIIYDTMLSSRLVQIDSQAYISITDFSCWIYFKMQINMLVTYSYFKP